MFRRLEPTRATAVTITVDGAPLVARAGDSIAAALLADGHATFGHDADGVPRTPYCLGGTCQQCLVSVDDSPGQPACTTQVREGMRVLLQAVPAASDTQEAAT